jgi:hypothetical protein
LDSSITDGLLGGGVAVLLGPVITRSAAAKQTNGKLYYGSWLFLLGLVCLLFTAYLGLKFLFGEELFNNSAEATYGLILICSFGVSSYASLAEYLKVKGQFDSDIVTFYSPWTGVNEECWENLVSVNFNALMYWFVLEFESGKSPDNTALKWSW